MEYIVTSAEMKRFDQTTIIEFKMPSAVLMERAALACVEMLKQPAFDLSRVLVVCGPGNNGGDGLAIARILKQDHINVEVLFMGNEASCTSDTRLQKEICKKYGVKLCSKAVFSEYTSIVDAIFGIGLSRAVQGVYRKTIELINQSEADVLAVDIPSGIHSDTGQIMGVAVKADVTVTFAFKKRGLFIGPGKNHTGEVVRKDIGITEDSFGDAYPKAYSYNCKADMRLRQRTPYSNKGTFGKVLIIAGSYNMSGAALLCAKAAYRTGTGLVHIFSSEYNRIILQQGLPEALMTTYETGKWYEALAEVIHWPSVIGFGPGVGSDSDKLKMLDILINETQVPLVLDADALTLLSQHKEMLEGHQQPIIITPHVGEMARLCNMPKEDIINDLAGVAVGFAKEYHIICVLKDAGTIVTDGEEIYINQTGNCGMATGGSGDVLTGIIAGLIAQGNPPFRSACAAVYLHGLAGDAASQKHGMHGMLAGDIIEGLEQVLR